MKKRRTSRGKQQRRTELSGSCAGGWGFHWLLEMT